MGSPNKEQRITLYGRVYLVRVWNGQGPIPDTIHISDEED